MSDSNITKKALGDSMKALMAARSFSKISVGDIAAGCGLTRKSFYYHFQDKYDLVNWIFYAEFMSVMLREENLDGWDFLEKLCGYFYENRPFYAGVFSVRGQNCFSDYFESLMKPVVGRFFGEVFADSPRGDFYALFYMDGVLAAILRWLREGEGTGPAEFTRLVRSACVGAARLILSHEDGAGGEVSPSRNCSEG